MNQRLTAILEAAVVCAVGGAALGDQASLTSSGDTTLYSESGTLSNGAGEHMFTGFTSGGPERRCLIRFDIAQAIPAHSTINSVSLVTGSWRFSCTARRLTSCSSDGMRKPLR